MIARTTLALMLACPAATVVLTASHHASAESRRPCRACSTQPLRYVAGARGARGFARRSSDTACRTPTSTGVCDDGLAYDTPRDTEGRPLSEPALRARPILFVALGAAARSGATPWQTGIASWYGGARWQGHLTSSGTRYDENAMTAAHASLPLGSQARVRLVGSDREVVVTITDRPGTRTRVIDLSRGAAARLGILSQGVARVAIDPM